MMLISLFVFVINNRSKEAFWLSGLFTGFILANIGLMFYHAKMGGLIYNEQIFFYLNIDILRYIQRFIITIDNITRFLIWGRALFLFFVLMFALYLLGIQQKRQWLGIIVALFPLLHAIAIDPAVFENLSYEQREFWYPFGNFYMIAYLVISIVLMLREYFNHNIRWVKRQLRTIILFVSNMILYFVIFLQVNPMSTMYYSRYTMFDMGFKVYRLRFSITAWYLLFVLFALFIIMGLFALFRYTRVNKEEHRDNISLERQMDTAQLGTQVFIHGIKNQLFSERIILRRLNQATSSSEVNMEDVKQYLTDLNAINESMTSRIEKLHQVFKQNTMSLVPCHLSEVVDLALQRLHNHLGPIECEVSTKHDALILADMPYLSEAVYNILSNAVNAIQSSPRANSGKINIIQKVDHHWCAIRIEDNGIGISRAKLKKIFEPFYTDKNSNYNWGIGLSYVKQITKLHFGKLHVESKEGAGTVFILAFPIYKPRKSGKRTNDLINRSKENTEHKEEIHGKT